MSDISMVVGVVVVAGWAAAGLALASRASRRRLGGVLFAGAAVGGVGVLSAAASGPSDRGCVS